MIVSDDIPNDRPPAAQASRHHDAGDPGMAAGLPGSARIIRGGSTSSPAQGMEAVRVFRAKPSDAIASSYRSGNGWPLFSFRVS